MVIASIASRLFVVLGVAGLVMAGLSLFFPLEQPLIIAVPVTVMAMLAVMHLNERQMLQRLELWLRQRTGEADEERDIAVSQAEWEWVARPVGELVERSQQLRQRFNELRLLLDEWIALAPDPLLLLGPEDRLLRSSRSARKVFAASTSGVPLAAVVRDPGLLSAVTSARKEGRSSEIRFSPASQSNRHFNASILPFTLPQLDDPPLPVVLVIMREESEQILIERMRSDFIANVSHELKTPLATLQGFIETLDGPARNDARAQGEFLGIMSNETRRMIRLVEDLLSLSRLEQDAGEPLLLMVDLSPVIQRVVHTLSSRAAEMGMELVTALDPLPELRGDFDQLQQALTNLVDNAIRYGGGKQVVIAGEHLHKAPAEAGHLAGHETVAVSVEDHGAGIEARHLQRLTERFYRVDNARSRQMGGTGLGLAIVKHIARRHGAHLAIASEPGAGSRFTLFFPVPSPVPAPVIELS